MRLTRYQLFLLGAVLLIALGPLAFTQPGRGSRGSRGGMPGGGTPGGGMPGGGDMNAMRDRMRQMMDPNTQWEQFAQGKDSININEIQFPESMAMWSGRIKERWSAFLAKKGVTNGVMTKEMFMESAEESRKERESRMGGMRMSITPGGTPEATPGTPGAPATPPDPKQVEEEARRFFSRTDRNNDGVIDREEARNSRTLGADFDRFDRNRDGKISADEYVEAFKERQAQRSQSQQNQGGLLPDTPAPVVEEKKNIVYRAGNLPKDIPAWFAQMDKDKDGQVGLYEWRADGKVAKDFLQYDQNGDGFVTVEELLRFQKAEAIRVAKKNGTNGLPGISSSGTTVAAGTPAPPGGGGDRRGMMRGGGGRPGMGMGARDGQDGDWRSKMGKGGRTKGGGGSGSGKRGGGQRP